MIAAGTMIRRFVDLLEHAGAILPSTRRFFHEAGHGLKALHGYVYGRWTRRYVSILLNPRLSPSQKGLEWFAERYHSKILTHDHAHAIVTNDRDIPLQDLEQIMPFPVARNLVLKASPDIAAYECVCRHNRPSHCQPTQVCMVIGQPVVDFVLEHHPTKARRLTRVEALELLEAEHQRGHVHSAWFKDAMLDRFYAICNCCKCCCGGIQAMKQGAPIMASSGYVAEVDAELCAACGACADDCPFDAILLKNSVVERDWELCLGCGVCEVKCPSGAVTMVRDERKGLPLDVRALPA